MVKAGVNITFEDYLMDQFLKEYAGCKDGFLDQFEDWLGNLQIDDWIKHGDSYANNKNHL